MHAQFCEEKKDYLVSDSRLSFIRGSKNLNREEILRRLIEIKDELAERKKKN